MLGSLFIAIRSLKNNALSTFITSFSIALACGLMMAVYSFKEQARDVFIMKDLGYDAVVGAKGSQLQLVLNSIYHLEDSPETFHGIFIRPLSVTLWSKQQYLWLSVTTILAIA